jgi:hypothetical protein
MPFIFIHGVNVRNTDEKYQKNLAARNALIQRLILSPLAENDERFKRIEIVSPYWGKHGVDFKWGLASLPDLNVLESLGAEDNATPLSDVEFTQTLAALSFRHASIPIETLGTDETLLKEAARKNLTRFTEAALSAFPLSESRLVDPGKLSEEQEGRLEALLAIAALNISNDPSVKAGLNAQNTAKDVIDFLKTKVQEEVERQIDEDQAAGSGESSKSDGSEDEIEVLGPDWVENLKARVGEVFDRVRSAPGRVLSIAGLQFTRRWLHHNLTRFLGDIFIYLQERGDQSNPGPIVSTVLDAIHNAPRNHPDEPLIVMTHSMGGNILYDILTYYEPNMKVDVWVSVGGQVAQFEEMKIFKASDKQVGKPNRVTGLRLNVLYWLNVYDPADILSFKAGPVFQDVNDDVEYSTGASTFNAYGDYFGRASFHAMVKEKIESVFKKAS